MVLSFPYIGTYPTSFANASDFVCRVALTSFVSVTIHVGLFLYARRFVLILLVGIRVVSYC